MFKFGEAAEAAGLTQGQLRNWLARYDDLWLSKDREPGKWREFSFADCVALAVTNELVGFGATVVEANEVAFQILCDGNLHLADGLEHQHISVKNRAYCFRRRDGAGWDVFQTQSSARNFAVIAGAPIVLEIDPAMIANRVANALGMVGK